MGAYYETQLNEGLGCIDIYLVERDGKVTSGEFLGRLYKVDRHYVLHIPTFNNGDKIDKPIAVFNTSNQEKAIKFSKKCLEKMLD